MKNQSIAAETLSRRNFVGVGTAGVGLLGAFAPSLARAYQGQTLAASGAPTVPARSVQAANMTIAKIKGDLYAVEGGGGNVAVYVTSEGVIIVDAKNYGVQFYDALMAQIRTVTDKPVKYLINTHYHADHIGGNIHFAPTVQIVQHANARKNIVNRVETRRPPAPQPPQGVPGHTTFTTEASVYLGGKEVHARYIGNGHTNGDAFIFFPAERTLHTGDMMSNLGGTFGPLVDYDCGGSLLDVTKTHDELLKYDFDIVIPGHGAVTDKAGLRTHRDNVEKFRNRAGALIHEGRSHEEVAKVLGEEYKWAPNNLNMWWTVPGLLKELS
jgi:glyoxylase-like metal-dependent hydrolase (beta-lactamase superfamily II)